jgi:two-component system, sensor histidine kinase and response regulator
MTQNLLYTQTAKGRAEIAATPGKLPSSFKTLLGMIGDKSTFAEVKGKLPQVPEDKLHAALEKLAAEGYIEASEPAKPADEMGFAAFMNQPVKEPTVQERQQAEQQTVSGMRTLRSAGYFVNILSRPGKRIVPRTGDKYSVLILDGDQANSLLLARALMLAKFDVRSAARPDQIMTELDKPPPDVIIMDVVLPELVGLALLAKMREHPNFKRVPIIIVTAQVEQDDVVAALVYGASGYMSKPVQPEALLESLRTVLGLG